MPKEMIEVTITFRYAPVREHYRYHEQEQIAIRIWEERTGYKWEGQCIDSRHCDCYANCNCDCPCHKDANDTCNCIKETRMSELCASDNCDNCRMYLCNCHCHTDADTCDCEPLDHFDSCNDKKEEK